MKSPSRPCIRFRIPVALFFALSFVACATALAATGLITIASGLNAPLYATSAGDGSGRLFIVEQSGVIRVLSGGLLFGTPFLDIRDRVTAGGELGLLGLTFHPNYRVNGRFFVNYTRPAPNCPSTRIETAIAEYSASSPSSNVAQKQSERTLLTFCQPFENHNGGMVGFGPDGFLYIATGDGGAGGDPMRNGQNLNALLGKILRIDVDSGNPYGIPPDNPFVGRGRSEIFAYGLRNPFRFSFDRLSGRLFAGDVGQDTREEVDIIIKGGNYGWNMMEGSICFPLGSSCNRTGLILPIHDYGRSDGSTVTGGYVYRGRSIPSLSGKYVFGDFGSGGLWTLTELPNGQWQRAQLLSTGLLISSFGEDENGEIYLVDYSGTVRQIVDSGVPATVINDGGVVSAAGFLAGAIAPGEIISIFGTAIGPDLAAGARLNAAGVVDNFIGDTKVFFDGVPAPLYYAQANQINVQVPYSVAQKTSTVVQVQYQNVLASPVTVPVADTAPAIFTVSGGTGQAAALNQDTSYNSSSNPAARGSVVVLYATGEGQTNPPGVDGKLALPPYPAPARTVLVTIGGLPADILFVGGAPGFAGLLQVNVRVPAGVQPGNNVSVELTIGSRSQAGVTIAIR